MSLSKAIFRPVGRLGQISNPTPHGIAIRCQKEEILQTMRNCATHWSVLVFEPTTQPATRSWKTLWENHTRILLG